MDTSGQHLSIAVFCEKLLQEKDGGISLIRVLDRYHVSEPTETIPVQTIPLTLVILMRSGIFRGAATIKVQGYSPSGQALPPIELPTYFEGDDERGSMVVASIGFAAKEQGLHWFDVLIDNELKTRIPLRIVFQKAGPGVLPHPQS
ncbi:MAG: hypothetical protein JOZ32_00265 [Bryobacterales bacterium]|nr:hypothetical protein [Bryobacterales bacterium]